MGLADFYEAHVLPRMVEYACGTGPVRHQRDKVLPRAEGKVLEIGMGSGLNLPHYDPSRVREVDGLEPSEAMRRRAERRARDVPFHVRFLGLQGESIPADDGSYDTVVITYTLCTIPDPVVALEEMRRVLRPGGALLFCEHGRAPDAGVRKWQRRIDPVWSRFSGGCHLDRPIPELIERGGFAIDDLEQMYLPNSPRFNSFNFWGRATPVAGTTSRQSPGHTRRR